MSKRLFKANQYSAKQLTYIATQHPVQTLCQYDHELITKYRMPLLKRLKRLQKVAVAIHDIRALLPLQGKRASQIGLDEEPLKRDFFTRPEIVVLASISGVDLTNVPTTEWAKHSIYLASDGTNFSEEEKRMLLTRMSYSCGPGQELFIYIEAFEHNSFTYDNPDADNPNIIGRVLTLWEEGPEGEICELALHDILWSEFRF